MENIISSSTIKILSADNRLMELLKCEPRAMMIPFMQSRESFFLLVSLLISDDHSHFDGVASACLLSLNDLLLLDFVSGLPAIEIAVWEEIPHPHPQQYPTQRVFRLSVRNQAFSKALELTTKDLLRDEPFEGIRCSRPITQPT